MPDFSSPDTLLAEGLRRLEQPLSPALQARLIEYLELLATWNRRFNLTAVRDPAQMVIRHLLDSLAVRPYLPAGALLDVGSGGGVPGLVLAVTEPERPVTVLDSNGKKARFMREAVRQLAIANAEVVESRVEAWQPPAPFPLIISRAFSEMATLVKLTRPLLAPGGLWLAMKGQAPEAELAALPPGSRLRQMHRLQVPFLDAERCLVVLEAT